MLYIGIIVGIIAIVYLKNETVNKNVEETMEDTGIMKNVTDTKVILFLVGIMILAEVGSSKMLILQTLRDVIFIILLLYLGYVLFKKLFLK